MQGQHTRGPPQRGPQRAGGATRGIDAGDVVHQIYVKVVDSAIDPDKQSKALTLQLLNYVHQHLAEFKNMGVAMKVNKIRSVDLQNPRLIAAMKQRGITNLPAVTTQFNQYIGLKAIYDLYDRNLREHAAILGRGDAPVQGAVAEDEDIYHKFYGNEMTLEKAKNDTEDPGIGDNGEDLMTAMREFTARREESAARRPAPRSAASTPGGSRQAPPQSRPQQRPSAAPSRTQPMAAPRGGNVAPPQESDPDDRDFNDMLERMSRDIDDNTRTAAFSSGGGDADYDESASNPQDDLMVSAYFANQISSDDL